MLNALRDRFRVPWYNGARKISIDAIFPIFIIPIIIGIAALSWYCALLMCIVTPIFLSYSHFYLKRYVPRTKFFLMWSIWSIIYLLVLFQLVVPLLELLPEETYILFALTFTSIFFFCKTKQRASQNFVTQNFASSSADNDDQVSLIVENLNLCQICLKYMPPRTFHCATCQTCVVQRNHHSYWLDCCIAKSNFRYYICGLIFALIAILFGTDLILTSVCHPFLIFKVVDVPVLLPDDCNEVFDQYEMGISFIISIYALFIAAFILFTLIFQLYLFLKGFTLSEWQQENMSKKSQSSSSLSVCWKIRSLMI